MFSHLVVVGAADGSPVGPRVGATEGIVGVLTGRGGSERGEWKG